ncbi:DUF3011 domain-containing protein [Flexibacterium corallicola]|uniref:DUF3011 domain-containing protein n=1 Tax=Flexibacterium corallicola TaxID=3037259 RepID=UPI00286F896F|nr:DUF3011 domain-containing protein [Pseudovibrio sp. M1P-2-3]
MTSPKVRQWPLSLVLSGLGIFAMALPQSVRAQDNFVLPEAPMQIFQACLLETGGAVGSKEFRQCLLDKAVGGPVAGPEPVPAPEPIPQPQPVYPPNPAPTPMPNDADMIGCNSTFNERNHCFLRPARRNYVALARQTSPKPCIAGSSWGVDATGIWVDKGCRGIFYTGRTTSTSPDYQRWSTYTGRHGKPTPVPGLPMKTKDGWIRCALEHQACEVPSKTLVRFGTPGHFTEREVKNSINCTRKNFGDPAPLQKKACYYLPQKGSGTPQPPAPEPVDLTKGPVRNARHLCEAQASRVLTVMQQAKKPVSVTLGLGSFSKAKENHKPVLSLKGQMLSGRGIYKTGKNWRPFSFQCLLDKKRQAAFNITINEEKKTNLSGKSFPLRDRFTKKPAPVSGSEGPLQWQFIGGTAPRLTHGVRETDDRDFIATCNKRTKTIDIVMIAPPASFFQGQSTRVSISSKTLSEDYSAFGSSPDSEGGVSLPVVRVGPSAPLWKQMIKDRELAINIGGYLSHKISLSGSAKPIKTFLKACQ